MRRSVSRGIALMLLLALVFACGKDDAKIYGEVQSPINSLFPDLKYIGATVDAFFPSEFGTVIGFSRDGRVSELCANVPDDGTYRVTLWELTDTTAIISAVVDAEIGHTNCTSIDPVSVSAGNTYAITIYTRDHYTYVDHAGVDIFPITVGDVEIIEFRRISDISGLVFPILVDNDVLLGLADLVFEPEL